MKYKKASRVDGTLKRPCSNFVNVFNILEGFAVNDQIGAERLCVKRKVFCVKRGSR